MAYKKRFQFVLLIPVLILAACSTRAEYSQNTKALTCENQLWHETNLFLGRSIVTGGEVSETEWDGFVTRTVTPSFPDGFSVVNAKGYWDNDGNTEHEKSKVLIILHDGSVASHDKIEKIANRYMKKFNQKYVIGGTSVICPHFYENLK